MGVACVVAGVSGCSGRMQWPDVARGARGPDVPLKEPTYRYGLLENGPAPPKTVIARSAGILTYYNG